MVGNNKGRYAVLGEHAVTRTGKPVTGAREGHACNAEILEDRRRVLPVVSPTVEGRVAALRVC